MITGTSLSNQGNEVIVIYSIPIVYLRLADGWKIAAVEKGFWGRIQV